MNKKEEIVKKESRNYTNSMPGWLRLALAAAIAAEFGTLIEMSYRSRDVGSVITSAR